MDLIERRGLDLMQQVELQQNLDHKKKLLTEYLHGTEETSPCLFPDSGLSEDLLWINSERPLSRSDLSGKLVLFDFFTYCCINCIHIMPFLHRLEERHPVPEGLAVIGVHSAKFMNEKVHSNIKDAVERYNIKHPVVNDSELKLWDLLSVKCWPTLVLLSPDGKVLFSIPGESHLPFIEIFVEVALEFYHTRGQLNGSSLPLEAQKNNNVKSNMDTKSQSHLRYPGKIAMDPTGKNIAISDSGNNRILISDADGNVSHIIGGEGRGFADGNFRDARFNSPQGVTWHGSKSVFVADCDNHAIRKIDLMVKKVVTVAGTGQQGDDVEGGATGMDQMISSPWDLIVGGSPRVPAGESILYIAMSGCHQVWALFLKTTDFQEGGELELGTCIRFAGNGKEENRNNSYPHKAGFAQPSGLTHDLEGHCLYVADSESSTVRRIQLTKGSVQAVVGGDIDPNNLFAYGDEDGKGRSVRLQHPLGVAWDHKRKLLYVADTYNHKIKVVDPEKKTCATMELPSASGTASKFNEPCGICLDPTCSNLYVADTNNHTIKFISLEEKRVSPMNLNFTSTLLGKLDIEKSHGDATVNKWAKSLVGEKVPPYTLPELAAKMNGQVKVVISCPDFKLSPQAPSSWQISVSSGKLSDKCEEKFERRVLVDAGKFPPSAEAHAVLSFSSLVKSYNFVPGDEGDSLRLCIECILYHCSDELGACNMHRYKAILPVKIENDGVESATTVLTVSVT